MSRFDHGWRFRDSKGADYIEAPTAPVPSFDGEQMSIVFWEDDQ